MALPQAFLGTKGNQDGPAGCSTDITCLLTLTSLPTLLHELNGQVLESVSAQFTQFCTKSSQESSQVWDTHLLESTGTHSTKISLLLLAQRLLGHGDHVSHQTLDIRMPTYSFLTTTLQRGMAGEL